MSESPRGSARGSAGSWRDLLHEQRRDTLADMCARLAGQLTIMMEADKLSVEPFSVVQVENSMV